MAEPGVVFEAEIPIPLKRVKAWFFDLDGTLMDTDDQAVNSLANKLRFLGALSANRLARWLIMKSETPMNFALTLVDILGMDTVLFKLRAWLHRHQPKPTFRIIEGVKPMLEYLHEHAELVVVSTRSQVDAMAFLEQHGLADLFSLVVSQESTPRLKPHPDPVIYAAQALGLSPDACVMVGDTTVDVLSARRAGAWAVGVLCGFGEEAELQRAGAHLVLSSSADLRSYASIRSGAKPPD
ncbi:MAG: HAD family hydrolase [Anaerolineae bacterium]|nr:HAD family hydrolase [Anaerolineae bacterium]